MNKEHIISLFPVDLEPRTRQSDPWDSTRSNDELPATMTLNVSLNLEQKSLNDIPEMTLLFLYLPAKYIPHPQISRSPSPPSSPARLPILQLVTRLLTAHCNGTPRALFCTMKARGPGFHVPALPNIARTAQVSAQPAKAIFRHTCIVVQASHTAFHSRSLPEAFPVRTAAQLLLRAEALVTTARLSLFSHCRSRALKDRRCTTGIYTARCYFLYVLSLITSASLFHSSLTTSTQIHSRRQLHYRLRHHCTRLVTTTTHHYLPPKWPGNTPPPAAQQSTSCAPMPSPAANAPASSSSCSASPSWMSCCGRSVSATGIYTMISWSGEIGKLVPCPHTCGASADKFTYVVAKSQ